MSSSNATTQPSDSYPRRAASIEPNDARHRRLAHALAVGCRLIERLRVIDFKSYEPLSAEAAVTFMHAGAASQVDRSLGEATRLIHDLPALVAGEQAMAALEQVEDSDTALGDGTAVDGFSQPPHDRFAEEMDAALARLTMTKTNAHAPEPAPLGDIAPMLVMELRGARERLRNARNRHAKWAIITEGEEGRRKAIKALQYGLRLAAASLPDGALMPEWTVDPTELEKAIRVRTLLMEFRNDILRWTLSIDDTTDAGVVTLVRDVRVRVVELFLSPEYSDLRSPDRYALQTLRERIREWLDDSRRSASDGRHILSDVRAFAELLAGINNRETLIEHDRSVRDRAAEELSDLRATLDVSVRGAWERYSAILHNVILLGDRAHDFGLWLRGEIDAGRSPSAQLAERIDAATARLAELQI